MYLMLCTFTDTSIGFVGERDFRHDILYTLDFFPEIIYLQNFFFNNCMAFKVIQTGLDTELLHKHGSKTFR